MCIIATEQTDIGAFKNFTDDASAGISASASTEATSPPSSADSGSSNSDYPPHIESK